MEEKIEALLNKYNNEQIQSLLYNFFRINFTLEEIDLIVPIIRGHWKEGYDKSTRDQFLERIKNATSNKTMTKIYHVLDLVENYYQFKI